MIGQKTSAPAMEMTADAEHSSVPWHAFDHVFCISLATRPDRRRACEEQFHRVGLAGRVQFMTVDRHPTDSEQGIYESHMKCLRAGLADGAGKILIFEDDVHFHRFQPSVLADSIKFMNAGDHWQMFFLGCFVKSSRKTTFRSVLQVRYRCSAHAYVVNRPFAEKLVDIPWRGTAFDDLLCSMTAEPFYTCYPALASQSGSPTDNDKIIWVDRVRRTFGGMRLLQRWNEFSNHNLWKLVAVHAVLLAIIIIASYLICK